MTDTKPRFPNASDTLQRTAMYAELHVANALANVPSASDQFLRDLAQRRLLTEVLAALEEIRDIDTARDMAAQAMLIAADIAIPAIIRNARKLVEQGGTQCR